MIIVSLHKFSCTFASYRILIIVKSAILTEG
nr:MAG TPA: hypothetical protein [Caudoviricetes sp.]